MSYYHVFCALLAERNRRHIRVLDFFLVQWLAVISGQKGLSFVSRSWLGFFPPAEGLHICYFPHFFKRTQVGGPFPEALGPLPMVGNNQINVAEEYSLHGQHLIAILLWNYGSQS